MDIIESKNDILNEDKLAEIVGKYYNLQDIDESKKRQSIENEQAERDPYLLSLNEHDRKEASFQILIQHDYPINLRGFEKDSDLINFDQELNTELAPNLRNKLLISDISYDPENNIILFGNLPHKVPNEIISGLINKYPDFDWTTVKRRAFSECSWTLETSAKVYYRTPIKIYSFLGEKLDDISAGKKLPYLLDNPFAERMKNYKRGTIWHEIGHSIFSFVIEKSDNLEIAWQKISEKYSYGITPYSFLQANHRNRKNIYHSEQFAEAMRLYMKNKEYLQKKCPDVFEFLKNFFDSID